MRVPFSFEEAVYAYLLFDDRNREGQDSFSLRQRGRQSVTACEEHMHACSRCKMRSCEAVSG